MRVLGMMSGTSLDGVDVACVDFKDAQQFQLIGAKTYAYPDAWVNQLKNAIYVTKHQLLQLDEAYGLFLGNIALQFIQEFKIENIDFIASHGHTIFHQPEKGYTLQIGHGQALANQTKCKVICDFRTQDVALGGQGAPLVPIGDQFLFQKYRYCLNLGGFANISFQDKNKRMAFDICPVNTVLNFYAQKLGFPFDEGGNLAKNGDVNEPLLSSLNALAFYQQLPPKSLGIEWVHQHVFPLLEASKLAPQAILATFTKHIALQISTYLTQKGEVLVTGGGAFNTHLIEQLQQLSLAQIHIPHPEIVNFKEALIFAYLGYLKQQGKVNCLSSVTGAKYDHSSGKIFYSQTL